MSTIVGKARLGGTAIIASACLFPLSAFAMEISAQPDPEAETPQSIVGAWKMSTGYSDGAAKPGCSNEVVFDVEITEDTISTNAGDDKPQTLPYETVGGNSTLHIIEMTDEAGDEITTSVELVPGGIRIRTLDCMQYPDKCEQAGFDMSNRILLEASPVWVYFVPEENCEP